MQSNDYFAYTRTIIRLIISYFIRLLSLSTAAFIVKTPVVLFRFTFNVVRIRAIACDAIVIGGFIITGTSIIIAAIPVIGIRCCSARTRAIIFRSSTIAIRSRAVICTCTVVLITAQRCVTIGTAVI